MQIDQKNSLSNNQIEKINQHRGRKWLYPEFAWELWLLIGSLLFLAILIIVIFSIWGNSVSNHFGMILGVVAVSFLITATISTVIWWKCSRNRKRRLRKIIALLDRDNEVQSDPQGSFKTLEDLAKKMYQTTIDDEERLAYQDSLLREHYLARLMKGNLRSVDSAYEVGKRFGIDWNHVEMRVMIFAIEETSELSATQWNSLYRNLKQCLQLKSEGRYLVYPVEVDTFIGCVLMPVNGESLRKENGFREVHQFAEECLSNVEGDFPCVFRIGISGVNTGIAGIAKAFSQAVDACQYQQLVGEENEVLFYNDMPVSPEKEQEEAYWFEKERQFLNCIHVSDYTNAELIFNKILVNNCISSAPSLQVAKYRMSGLVNSLMNALGEIRLSIDDSFFKELSPYNLLMECKSIPQLQRRSRRIFEAINTHMSEDKKASTNDRIKEIAEYLKENYHNPDLSVMLLAEKFQLNPSYLSRVFKKQMGIGLSEYLQKIRIESAKELMRRKDLSIKEISEQVGYNNVMTMNRAFKKHEGTTPGRIR